MREWVTVCLAGAVGGLSNVVLALLKRRTVHGRVILAEDRPLDGGRYWAVIWLIDNGITAGCTILAGGVAAFVFWCLNSSSVDIDGTRAAVPSRVVGAVIAGLGGAKRVAIDAVSFHACRTAPATAAPWLDC